VSLSQDPTFGVLRDKFVCGWRDISGESYCGKSGQYGPDDGAVWTTNGAGPHNMQLFVLAPDGTVLHCLPGYWNSADLALELAFARELYEVWRDDAPRKNERFAELHRAHAHPAAMVARSDLQKFDQKFEKKRARTSDCFTSDGKFKTTDRIMHDRMAARPFVAYDNFDVETYSDYGRPKYDKKKAHRAP
jgi:hypothetical protein